MIVTRLTKRSDVYGRVETTNQLEETDFTYDLIKSVWCEIVPLSGSKQPLQGGVEQAEVSHRFTIRTKAITLQQDMYFVFSGQKYTVSYWMPNYKFNDSVDVFCNLVVE